LPVNSLSDLVALLRNKSWGSSTSLPPASATPSHLIGEMFALQAGVHATHVPYQQFPQAIADLISGQR